MRRKRRTGGRLQVGVVAALANTYARSVMAGLASYGHAHGPWALECGDTVEELLARMPEPDGILAQVATEALARQLQRLRVPVANFSNALAARVFPTVVADDVAVGRMAAQHFLERGYASFLYYGRTVHYAQLRGEGFRAALAEAGHQVRELHEHPLMDVGALARLPRPLAVFASQDAEARQIVDLCLAVGLGVPEDVAVLGVNNDELEVGFCEVPISSIVLPGHQIGFRAAGLLDQMMQGRKVVKAALVVGPPGELIVRSSTDAMAIRDPEIALVMRVIRAGLARELSVADLVRVSGLSRRALELRFRAVMGRAPAAEIRRLRLARARRLLGEAELSVAAVGRASGFGSAARFAKVFRADVGLTPREYRQRLREGADSRHADTTARRPA